MPLIRSLMRLAAGAAVLFPRPLLSQGAKLADADSVSLTRTLCFGTCPAYHLTISRNGHVVFISQNPGDSGRTGFDSLRTAAFDSVITELNRAGVLGYPARVADNKVFCPRHWTDLPTAVVTVYSPSGRYEVEDYHGCDGDGLAPLRTAEDAIDSIVGSARWVRPANIRP